MKREALQPEGLVTPALPYSPVMVSGDLVYTTGQVGLDPNGELVSLEFEPQVRQTLENLGKCLAAAGCTFDDVIKVTNFVTSYDEFDTLNKVYREFFDKPPYPARTTVQVGLPPTFLVEIELVARKPS